MSRQPRKITLTVAIVGLAVVALPPPARPSEGLRPGPLEAAPPLTETLDSAQELLSEGKVIEARRLLLGALASEGRTDEEQGRLREVLGVIQEIVLFSHRVFAEDPYTELYTVQPGDSLARITRRFGLAVDYRLLQRVNGLRSADAIRPWHRLKLVRGPFHAVVVRRDYRLDLHAGPADDPGRWMFVRSFQVGLGEGGSTPDGSFIVRPGGKVADPFWTDPRSGRWYAPGDPENPIGDRWIGLEGVGESAALNGYGIHGTIEPDSIGRQASLGCVRLLGDDVHLIYELLAEGVSTVRIEP